MPEDQEKHTLSEETKERIKDFFSSNHTLEIYVHSKDEEGTAIITWEKYEDPHNQMKTGKRHVGVTFRDNVEKAEEGYGLQEQMTEPTQMGIMGELSNRKKATTPEEVIQETEEIMEKANTDLYEGSHDDRRDSAEVHR